MSKIGLVIGREYTTRVKKKSFLIITILMPILLIALISAPLALSFIKSKDTKRIAIHDSKHLYDSRLNSNQQYELVNTDKSYAEIQKMISNQNDFYAFMEIKGDLSSDTGKVSLYAGKQIEMELKTFLKTQLDSLVRKDKIASFKIDKLEEIIQQTEPDFYIQTIKWDKDGSEKRSSSEVAMVIGLIATTIIYIFIFAYGAMVMTGVVEEKSNRIVEVIVSSVKPFELMMGKIIGIALVGLTQVMIWVALIGGIAFTASYALKDSISSEKAQAIGVELTKSNAFNQPSMSMNSTNQMGIDLNDTPVQEIINTLNNMNLVEFFIWFILFFLGGYLLYASLFAAIGSAIDNQDDANQFMLPVTMTVLFGLYAGIYSAQNPDGPLAFWCSMIPFTSPIVMMVRIPFGVPFWQLLLSFSLLIITFIGVVKISAKIYRTGILMYGKKTTYKELWKWIRYRD